MQIELFKERSIALWGDKVVWPDFKEAVVIVERPQCKGNIK
jgi:hypothetical protein